jgi:hypothetical protein
MIAVTLSLLFGVIAFAAIAQVLASIRQGAARGRLIVAELARLDYTDTRRVVPIRPVRRREAQEWRPLLAAA